jgi:cytoskeleton protein RodZ
MSEQITASELPVGEAGFDATPSVGAQLRAAREKRGIQLQELAHTLKLGARQVEALEDGNWQALPGHTFIRGFIRNYARLVQIDPAPLMAQLDGVLEKPVSRLATVESRPAAMPYSSGGLSRRDRNVVLLGAGFVAFAGLIYFLLPNDLSALRESAQSMLDSLSRKEAPPAAPAETPVANEPVFPPGSTPQQVMNPQAEAPASAVPVESAAPAAVVPAPAVPAAPPAATPNPTPVVPAAGEKGGPVPGAAPLRFVFDKESWVEVRDRDNKVIFSQRGTPGSEQALSGNGPYSLVIGYAPGVKLFWRGQSVDLAPHTRGDVARLVLE